MKIIDKITGRIMGGGAVLAGAVLVLIMILIVLDVVLRLGKVPIIGSYEWTQLLIVVTVAFALPYTALKKGHVVIDIITSHFSKRSHAAVIVFAAVLSLVSWALIFWAAFGMMIEKWFNEYSFTQKIPYLPFRIVWTVGLLLFCIIFLLDVIKAVKALRSNE